MAAKLAGSGGGKFDVGQNSDINVTPFVDILLVLLIIFMVAIPAATLAIKVDLPPAVQPTTPDNKKPTYINIKSGDHIFIVDAPTSLDRLGLDLDARFGGADPKSNSVLIRADSDIRYKEFMSVVNELQTVGYYKVGLISEDLDY